MVLLLCCGQWARHDFLSLEAGRDEARRGPPVPAPPPAPGHADAGGRAGVRACGRAGLCLAVGRDDARRRVWFLILLNEYLVNSRGGLLFPGRAGPDPGRTRRRRRVSGN